MTKLSSGQVAKILDCSVPTLHKIPPKQLPYTLVGTHRRYEEQDVRWYSSKQRRDGEASGV